MKILKERVLAMCKDAWESDDYPSVCNAMHIHSNTGGYWDIRNATGTIHYRVAQNISESDPVWPLAASVLGIKEDETDPFEAFIKSKTSSMIWELCESFFLNGMGWANSDMGDALTESDKIRFENVWAENAVLVHSIAKSLALPPDTPKEDRGDRTTENDYLSALKTLIVGSCRAMDDDRLSEAVYNHVSPFFLAIVRSVPNKEDRELIRPFKESVAQWIQEWEKSGQEKREIGVDSAIVRHIKRLCGLEVGG